ncbi:ribonuclease H-like domain-containing protein [Tanacetum coccineum]
MGLYDNYLAIRSNILNREPLPLVKVAFAIVSGEESHRNITSSGATKPNAFVFAAKTFDKKRHTVDRCFEILGYPAGYVKRNFILNSRPITNNNTTIDPHSNKASSNTTSNSPVSLSNEQLTRLMNLLNDNEVSTANADMSVNISNLGLTIGHPNETQSLITKIEDLKINNNITLYDVLVVPEYIASLLSVHKLSRDNKLFVGFNASNCYIQDLKANKILGIGRQFNGVYLFDVDNAYHLCDTCNKAKQTREPFPLSDHKSSKIGELVHLDVWGPYKITNRDGFRYFPTIVDDFSRAVWVYMLKGKDDVYDSIISFVL